MTKEQLESEVEMLKERFEFLKSKVDLLEILAKNTKAPPQQENVLPPVKKVIQINTKDGKTYFCSTPEQQQIFEENYPGAKAESFNIELAAGTADKYLEESKKHFTKKETVNA